MPQLPSTTCTCVHQQQAQASQSMPTIIYPQFCQRNPPLTESDFANANTVCRAVRVCHSAHFHAAWHCQYYSVQFGVSQLPLSTTGLTWQALAKPGVGCMQFIQSAQHGSQWLRQAGGHTWCTLKSHATVSRVSAWSSVSPLADISQSRAFLYTP